MSFVPVSAKILKSAAESAAASITGEAKRLRDIALGALEDRATLEAVVVRLMTEMEEARRFMDAWDHPDAGAVADNLSKTLHQERETLKAASLAVPRVPV